MSVSSVEFILLLMAVSAAFFWLPGVRIRQCVLAACNATFFCSQTTSWAVLASLAAILLTGYFVARWLTIRPSRVVLGTYTVILVCAFAIIKRYEFVMPFFPPSVFAHTIIIIGLSYTLFRQIHFLVDAMQGQIEKPSLWTYLNYQFNLFALVAGPIQRYQAFQQYWDSPQPLLNDQREVLKAYLRVFVGVLKIAMLAPVCLTSYEAFASTAAQAPLHGPWGITTGRFLAILYLYPAYLYLNFSGYCDIVIAAASLVGMKLPENFDFPFFSRNMIEYWTRWHKTLGFWIRDYIFTPLYKTCAQRWPRHINSLAVGCYMIAFFITGIWHGSTRNFVVFGILNGVGVSVAKLWEIYLVRRRGRAGFRKYLATPSFRAAAIALNFHFVCLTLFFFPTDLERSLKILHGVAAAWL